MANIEALKKVREAILAHREQFDYSKLDSNGRLDNGKSVYTLQDPTFDNIRHNCGTVGCVAGFAMAVLSPEGYVWGFSTYTAADALELTDSERIWLFFPWAGTPIPESDFTVDDAIDRLNWLIEGNDFSSYIRKDPNEHSSTEESPQKDS